MAHTPTNKTDDLVDSYRLTTTIIGAKHVSHTLNAPTARGGTEVVLYSRKDIEIGKGSFGQIYLEKRQNESLVAPEVRAVKEIKMGFARQQGWNWKRETEALILVNQSEEKNLFVSFYGWYTNDDTIFLAMEYCPLGDLSRYIFEVHEEAEVRIIAAQVITALCEMHRNQMVHRDLNPRNILVVTTAPNWRIELADFGTSKKVHDTTKFGTITGTSGYAAPEYTDFVRNSSEFAEPTTAVDLWSAGIVFYELYTKERPFSDEPGRLSLKSYYANPCLPDSLERSFASAFGQDCISRFLEPDPLARITAEEAILTHWLGDVSMEALDAPSPPVITNIDEAVAALNLDESDNQNPWGVWPETHSKHDFNMSSISLATSATLVEKSDQCLTPIDSRSRTPVPLNPKRPILNSQQLPSATISGDMNSEEYPTPLRPRPLQTPQTFHQSGRQQTLQPDIGPNHPLGARDQFRRASNTSTYASDFSTRPNVAPLSMPKLTKTVSAPNPPLPPRRSTASTPLPRYTPQAPREQLSAETYSQPRPTLPPRRRVSAPSKIPTLGQQQGRWQPPSCESVSEGAQTEEEYVEQPIDLEVDDAESEMGRVEDNTVQPSWLMCAYEPTELRMSMGPVSYQQERPPTCDHCEEEVMLRGSRGNSRLHTALFLCETCGKGRQLCERCAQLVIKKPGDPHEADHILRRVGPGVLLDLEKFLQDPNIDMQMADSVPPTYGGNWMNSDHGFEAPVRAGANSLRAQFFMTVPVGVYSIIVHLRISFNPARISSEMLGTTTKRRMKSFKEAYGYLDVGAEICPVDMNTEDKLFQRFMPQASMRQALNYSSGQMDQNVTVRLKQPISVQAGQRLILAVKSSHDPSIFKNGCPFRWHLSFASLQQYGPKTQLATKGQLIRREQIVENQREIDRHIKIDRNIGYANKLLSAGNNLTAIGQAGAAIRRSIAKRREHESSARDHDFSALSNYASAYNQARYGSVYGQQGYSSEYGGDDASYVDGETSDATYVWVSEQADQPFVASFEAVEYSDGSASASYVQYGVR